MQPINVINILYEMFKLFAFIFIGIPVMITYTILGAQVICVILLNIYERFKR